MDRKIVYQIEKQEKARIVEKAYDFQKTVSQFATVKECISYNQALRDFADHLTNESDNRIVNDNTENGDEQGNSTNERGL